MNFDDESDLTSLEDEDERIDANILGTNGKRARSNSNAGFDHDDVMKNGVSPPDEDARRSTGSPPPQLSPSRIGTAIARPAPAIGLKTYAGRKSHYKPKASVKTPTTPKKKKSPPPTHTILEGSSPVIPLSSASPSPRKRRVVSKVQQDVLSSPSKRARRSNGATVGDARDLVESISSHKGKITTDGESSSLKEPTFMSMKQKAKGNIRKNTAKGMAETRRRDELPKQDDAWSLETIGPLAWVRITRKNGVVEDVSEEECFWWPAKVEAAVSTRKRLQIRLFNPPTGSSTSLLLSIENPSPLNVLSYKNHSFTEKSFWSMPSASPRSHFAVFNTLKSRWEEACREMVKEDTRLHDGFPSSVVALLSQTLCDDDEAVEDVASSASIALVVESPSNPPEDEAWLPPPLDSNVSVPGEYVLSATKTKGCAGKYYPAKIIAYVPPSNRSVLPQYTMHFMDNAYEDVTRDMFYIYEQDEFGTCKLGAFESVESFHERDGEDDLDKNDITEFMEIADPPILPAPPPDKFGELSMMEQSSYVIPIMKKVIENTYKPAEERISAFLSGGRKRVETSKEALQKGILTRSEVNQLARIIKSWALRIESSDDEMRDVSCSRAINIDARDRPGQKPPPLPVPAESDVRGREVLPSPPEDLFDSEMPSQDQDREHVPSLPPSSLPPSSTADELPSSAPQRKDDDDLVIMVPADSDEAKPYADDHRPEGDVQTGTPRKQISVPTSKSPKATFKDLLAHEKVHFCTDVLLKEAVIQLLLWRTGRRRDPDVLSDKEEMLLHESGSNLASEFDIAHTVRDLRMKKEKSLQIHMHSKQPILTGGTRTRPRKV